MDSSLSKKELLKLSKKELIKKCKKHKLNITGAKTKSELAEKILRYEAKMKKEANKSTADKKQADEIVDFVDMLSAAVILKVVSFNSNHVDFTAAKCINHSFYNLLNPNKYAVNKIWEDIARHKYPFIPIKLKCKRWDIYYKYRIEKIKDAEKNNWDHRNIMHFDHANVIEGCDHDINNLNEEYEIKVSGNRISRKRGGKYDNIKKEELFKGEIGSNGLPKGFNNKLRCPMVMAGNWQFLNTTMEHKKYNCTACKRDVYTVVSLDEMKQKLSEQKCVRIVYYDQEWNYYEESMGEEEEYVSTEEEEDF